MLTQPGSLGFRVGGPHIGVLCCSGKTLIAFEIKVEALEQSADPQNAITTPLGGFDLVIQTLHETTAEAVREVVGNFIQPISECFQEVVETGQRTAADLILPFEQAVLACFFGQPHLKYGAEFFPERVGQLQLRRQLEQVSECLVFVGC